MTKPRKNLLKLLPCSACMILAFATAQAQETTRNAVHWAYSSYFGTGWYQVSGDRDVFVIRMTPRWELSEAELADDGTKTIGIEFRFPITAGLEVFALDNIPEILQPDNLASLSVTPGVEITVPINERWALRPFASLGYGTLLNGSESAWTYWAGVKSQYTFQNGNLNWALVNSVAYVGYNPNNGPSESFWPLMAGLEFDYPLGNDQANDKKWALSWHGMYTSFEDDLDATLENGATRPITDQWEFGVALGKKGQRIKIWFLSFDRLGLAYRFSSSGDLKGISFIFRSVFER